MEIGNNLAAVLIFVILAGAWVLDGWMKRPKK